MRRHPLVLLGLSFLLLAALAAVSQTNGPGAELVATIETGDDLAVVAAWSPDSQRLAYGTEKEVQSRRRENPLYPGEVWVTDFEKKPKRILKYDFLRNQMGDFFSFSVERVVWSPDGQRLAVEMTDERKNRAVFLLTAEGKRVELGSSSQNFLAGYGAEWLADSQSLALLSEAVAPRLLHRVEVVRVTAGRGVAVFQGKTFAAVAWLPHANKMVAVERDAEFRRPPRLVVGDLQRGTLETLDANAEGYLGGLQASPDETRVSYFVGQDKLAVRSLVPGEAIERWPVPFGRYAWAGPRPAVLYLEAKETGRRTGWLTLYDPARGSTQRVLGEELIQDFWVSPNGERVAVLTVGLKPQMKVYRIAP